mmetsp:Transcript_24438/g.48601  ORF Transcript_24438/g.48601 Transcript_24438/m.48601 type:complete len:123 (-) Transcript_24438:2-370(-)
MNAPERSDAIVLPENVRKVTYTVDSIVRDAGEFRLEREDHTMGNLLRLELLRNENQVLFAGYIHAHPLDNHISLKVRCTPSTNPVDCMSKACNDLQATLEELQQRWAAAVEQHQGRQDQGHF